MPGLCVTGRFLELKDYPNLIRAFAQVRTRKPGIKLAIVGDGPLKADLEAVMNSLGVTDDVHLLGVRHDIPELMSACDVFVLSSASEGFGLVVAEAMACERIVVATDCGGVREVVGNAGLLVPLQDPEKLASAGPVHPGSPVLVLFLTEKDAWMRAANDLARTQRQTLHMALSLTRIFTARS